MKKFLLIVLCLILACPAALAAPYAVESHNERIEQDSRLQYYSTVRAYNYEYKGTIYNSRKCIFENNTALYYIVTEDGEVLVTSWSVGQMTTIPTIITEENGKTLKITGLASMSIWAMGDNSITLTIPSSITTFDINPFATCYSVEAFRVVSDHETLATIDGVLFEKATRKLLAFPQRRTGEYIVPDGIVEIGDYSCGNFFGQSDNLGGLNSVIFPDSLKSIGDYAFVNCHMTFIELPEGFESIGRCAFFSCDNLEEVILPSTVTSIGAKAFDQTAVTTITIPASVEYIGEAAFGSIEGKTLIVEKGSYAAEYAAANGYYYEYVGGGDDDSWLNDGSDEDSYEEEFESEDYEETYEEPESYEEDDSWLE